MKTIIDNYSYREENNFYATWIMMSNDSDGTSPDEDFQIDLEHEVSTSELWDEMVESYPEYIFTNKARFVEEVQILCWKASEAGRPVNVTDYESV